MLKVSCLSKPLQDNLSQRPAANKGSSMSQLHKVTPDRFAFKFCHLLVLTSLASSFCSSPGQQADPSYRIGVQRPEWAAEQGPRVAVDAAHNNFHTVDGRYQAFAQLLREDGFRVGSFDSLFSSGSLIDLDVLVISNALAAENATPDRWRLPTYPAFTTEEVDSLVDWIENGGALLLIADHMPMPGAAALLATALGLEFTNTYAMRESQDGARPPITFNRDNSTLQSHSITDGRNPPERVERVATFTGQAFRGEATPLLTFSAGVIALYPEVFAQFDESTRRHSVEGWYQGAVLERGQGRVAVFGEAAMFSAQVSGRGNRMGMNAEIARENPQFLLNVMHWLTRVFD